MISTAGRCWSGNARSSTRRMARAKARSSSSITSSALPSAPSTILPGQAPTILRTARCSAWLKEFRMAMEASGNDSTGGRIRLGMVGGGQGAFIGAVHRIAARIDGQFELIAGALSSEPARAKASALELGIAAERSYGSFEEMARADAARPGGMEAVSIVTPNHVHAPAAHAFLEAG